MARISKRVQVILESDIANKIFIIRGQRVMLDKDLAELYNVSTKVFNQAVKRNGKRFPPDFMFKLNFKEFSGLRSQIVTSKGRGGVRYLPYAFTENGIAMLSSVLNSERAIQVNIQIMRIFTKIRGLLASHKDVLSRLNEMEKKLLKHDGQIIKIFEVINYIMNLPITLKRKSKPIGFLPPDKTGAGLEK